MSLQAGELNGLLNKTIEIDEFSSKMGEDKNIITMSFSVQYEEPAKDLVKFLEGGYQNVLDCAVSSGEQNDGTYRVFVEMPRSERAIDEILEIVEDCKKLAKMKDFRFRYYKNFRSIPADESNINEQVPLDSGTYDIKRNETKMENYKNFFADSYVDEVFMEGNNVHMHKKYGDNIVFNFIDMGWKKEVLESIKESIQIEAFPEIIFLSKYVGDYNITKFGNKLVFENNGHCVVLKRDEII